MPPGDVLLAAALAAALSLDEKLGMIRQANDIEVLRAQVAEMREEMAGLRALVAGGDGRPLQRPAAAEIAAARTDRVSRRQAWAGRSQAGAASPGMPAPPRRAGRASTR